MTAPTLDLDIDDLIARARALASLPGRDPRDPVLTTSPAVVLALADARERSEAEGARHRDRAAEAGRRAVAAGPLAVGRGIYVASRASLPGRAEMWRRLRSEGWPIVSTWIDEDGPGQTDDLGELWARIAREVAGAAGLVLYAEPGDFPLKGALVEVGMALAAGVPVVVVAPGVEVEPRSCRPVGSWMRHPLAARAGSVVDAFRRLGATVGCDPDGLSPLGRAMVAGLESSLADPSSAGELPTPAAGAKDWPGDAPEGGHHMANLVPGPDGTLTPAPWARSDLAITCAACGHTWTGAPATCPRCRPEADARAGDAPGAGGIDPGAIERAADRITEMCDAGLHDDEPSVDRDRYHSRLWEVCVRQPDRSAWRMRPSGNREHPDVTVLREEVAAIIRECLGLADAPAAGGDAGGPTDAD